MTLWFLPVGIVLGIVFSVATFAGAVWCVQITLKRGYGAGFGIALAQGFWAVVAVNILFAADQYSFRFDWLFRMGAALVLFYMGLTAVAAERATTPRLRGSTTEGRGGLSAHLLDRSWDAPAPLWLPLLLCRHRAAPFPPLPRLYFPGHFASRDRGCDRFALLVDLPCPVGRPLRSKSSRTDHLKVDEQAAGPGWNRLLSPPAHVHPPAPAGVLVYSGYRISIPD